jgi:hypothetical protein
MSARHRQHKRKISMLEHDRAQAAVLLVGYDAVIDDLLGRGYTPVDQIGHVLIVHRQLAEKRIEQLDEDIADLRKATP